jgi:hypothetical protein
VDKDDVDIHEGLSHAVLIRMSSIPTHEPEQRMLMKRRHVSVCFSSLTLTYILPTYIPRYIEGQSMCGAVPSSVGSL